MAARTESFPTQGKPMCACADREDSWRGRGQNATYVCLCGGATVSAKGYRWPPSGNIPADGGDPYREPDTDDDTKGEHR